MDGRRRTGTSRTSSAEALPLRADTRKCDGMATARYTMLYNPTEQWACGRDYIRTFVHCQGLKNLEEIGTRSGI